MADKKNPISSHYDTIRKDIYRLLKTQYFAVIATTDGSVPHASIIAFASTDSGASLLFLTPKQSTKYRNILCNPEVSLVIDSRPQTNTRSKKSCGVTVHGIARRISTKSYSRLSSIFFRRHPDLSVFSEYPDYALLIIKVKTFAHTNNLTDVTKITPGILRQI